MISITKGVGLSWLDVLDLGLRSQYLDSILVEEGEHEVASYSTVDFRVMKGSQCSRLVGYQLIYS